jgi:hypothetical protein
LGQGIHIRGIHHHNIVRRGQRVVCVCGLGRVENLEVCFGIERRLYQIQQLPDALDNDNLARTLQEVNEVRHLEQDTVHVQELWMLVKRGNSDMVLLPACTLMSAVQLYRTRPMRKIVLAHLYVP